MSFLGPKARDLWWASKTVLKGSLIYHIVTTHLIFLGPTSGISMVPTIPDSYTTRPWILYSSLHRRGRGIRVGDIVTYTHPLFPHQRGCKRVLGMPGDVVAVVSAARRDGDIEKDGDEGDWANVKEGFVRVPEGHCWLAGDNLEWSRDSRLFGPLPLGLVKAKVLAVVRPWESARWVGSEQDVVDVGV
ncbi:peptidase S24/S26A/S26B/S26C [Boeremia exigua]|uniref:peptidase S24/S26A/S26B/S26C n=1 Tax=Boeremia exigua TaxID=749465 RepID=UPI001E8E7E7B|nr:peptidase S24/S26A/S26B/S26C [Boeremia exigua]KAH6625471.1 peptidase S24/S26A/S26B/S26C [Boeremia exigua]